MHDSRAICRRGLLGLVLAGITFAPWAIAQTLPAAALSPTTLYVQTARSGTVSFNDEVDFTFVLELVDPNRYTTWFADRPDRQAGRMLNDRFLESVGDTEDNPVNAAIIANVLGASRPASVLPVQLWNGTNDNGSTITYIGRLLEPNSTLTFVGLTAATVPIDREKVVELASENGTVSLAGEVEVYIDGTSACSSCSSSCFSFCNYCYLNIPGFQSYESEGWTLCYSLASLCQPPCMVCAYPPDASTGSCACPTSSECPA